MEQIAPQSSNDKLQKSYWINGIKMSRFSLRSCSDGLKMSEEKGNRRKSSNPTSISAKLSSQQQQQKDTKFSTHLNEDNLIDDIKIETDETEKTSNAAADRPTKNKNNGGAGDDDDDEDDDDDDNDNDVDGDYRQQQSPVCKGTLVCSFPLDRINDIIQKLNLNKSKIENDTSNRKQFNEKVSDELMIDETLDNYDDEEDDANISKQSTSNVKNLCLYCDKKFSSHKMQLKHVDKFHCLQQDRRSSGRTTQMQNSQTPRKRKSTVGSQNFPGCNYCQKGKGQSLPVILQASELSSLFVHLTDSHADKYFGCKTCVLRFQNITKLSKHMEIVHKSLPFAFDESSSKSKDNDTDSLISNDKLAIGERSKLSLKRQQRSQKALNTSSGNSASVGNIGANTAASQCSTAITPNTSVIGAEEPILSRLGLTQNRLPNNRKGVRLRREKLLPEMLLKSEQNQTSSTNYAFGQTTSITVSASVSSTCSPKLRGKTLKNVTGFSGDASSDVVFRVPTRNDILSCVFDDNFYKEVVSNVRNNLLFHLDGKIMGNTMPHLETSLMRHAPQPQIRSTLVKSPIVVTTTGGEIHAATSLSAVTAFPTLLTAEQFGGEGTSSKIRRPHTKNSWKWKWDNVKKFKLINEGGKIIKKMKHPMLGLRDLSKLDMWTQLTMRQKHEILQQHQSSSTTMDDNDWNDQPVNKVEEITSDYSREEKQRLKDQLNLILDMRLLPHIILEQNEQAIIKLENDEFGIAPTQLAGEDCGDNFMAQTFADESFLSMLNLLPINDSQNARTKLVLSGEWARPRCYLCICCGAKFEKLKSLEEHKMFRHSQILSTHYEVVGRELLNGNLLRHLFLPKKALSRYGNDSQSNLVYSGAARRLFWHKNETLTREIANNDESSDSLQSILNSCTTNSPSLKNSSSTEDCDIDTKISTVAALELIENSTVVSPTHSIQSCSSSSSVTAGVKRHLKTQVNSTRPLAIASTSISNNVSSSIASGNGCSKCGRKCNGVLDLYRHMLDCSGDYIWSLAKKRKYRYYCGSKKRRPCNKHGILELRKNKPKPAPKALAISNDNTTEEGPSTSMNFTKTKTSPRPRPSDAESIKKMLENLPPKRICKKIFPTLSKAKKTMKNIKPKLLAKHKIYNTLRKTHVRQISQAAKILSKTKSQLNKPKKMATRSTATTPSTVAQNRSNQMKKNMKIMMSKTSKRKSGIKPTNVAVTSEDKKIEDEKETETEEECKDEVDCCIIKTENTTKAIESLTSETVTSEKPNSELKDNSRQNESTPDVLVTEECKQTVEKSSQAEELTNKLQLMQAVQLHGILSEETVNKEVEPIRNAIKHNETTPTSNTVINESRGVPVKKMTALSTVSPNDSERVVQINKNIKRGKRISDCIAMLTGKLEEKLKTEQRTSVATIIQEKPTASVAQTLKPLSAAAPQPLLPLQQQLLLPITTEVEVDKCSSKKTTPKRKAISRRIIKTDAVTIEESNIPIKLPIVDNENLQNLKTIKPIGIISAVKETLATKRAAIQLISTTSTVTTPTVTPTISETVFAPVEIKQMKTNAPATIAASMLPPVLIPQNTSNLMPKLPLYLPLDSLRPPPPPLTGPHISPLQLPLTLSQVPVPVPMIPMENVAQVSPAAGISIIPSSVIPMMSGINAHLSAPHTLSMTVPSFSTTNATAEPLNLSNSSKNSEKQSQDLSCSSTQRLGGIPARRQTICGFEARNFIIFDEMEPLDLSKKPKPEKTTSIAPLLPRPMELVPFMLPPQNALSAPTDTNILSIPPLTPESLLNKPFYSNLDLLRIPQVRNPAVGQVQIATNEPPLPPPPPPPIVINTVAAVPPTKPANKKRNKSSVAMQQAQSHTTAGAGETVAVGHLTTMSFCKTNNNKDLINTTAKKESSGKYRNTLRMDEEVINHIDDAINSVINAANASLDEEDGEKSLQQQLDLMRSQTPVVQPVVPPPKTTDDVNVAVKESGADFKYLTPARRNMRSKTLDCRPAALNKINVKNPSLLMAINPETNDDITSNLKTPTQTDNGSENLKILDTKKPPMECNIKMAISDTPKDNKNKPESLRHIKNLELKERLLSASANMHLPKQPLPKESSHNKIIETSSSKLIIDDDDDNITLNKLKETHAKEMAAAAPSIKSKNIVLKPSIICVSNTDASLASTTFATTITVTTTSTTKTTTATTKNTINTTNLEVEQMSNNNNTSSGFHSSAQSDQQTSVMSTTTSAASVPPTVIAADTTKKKQRRRRKNELAAIVADQLLESFKLDKARRDNLKKLENLAYEKSDDLLLTGMLLMPCTKRNVTSTSTSVNTNTTQSAAATADNSESTVSTKRTSKSQRNNQNAETAKVVETAKVSNKVTEDSVIEKPTANEKDKDAADGAEGSGADGKKTTKRRQYRRRGKTLDNENISKLKSSLESFSIDIERQLTEYESKNVNVFKSVTANEVPGKQSSNSKAQATTNTKPSIILRPSILSVTLEASSSVVNQEVTTQSTAKAVSSNDANKTVVSSRDPRLNKNIHKEGSEKNNDTASEKVSASEKVPPALLPPKSSTGPAEIGDLEEDNYLTEIAKNVNEKIMSTAENEEFAFKDDGFEMVNELGMDDSNSKFSRPPTSMSVRSAPNFNDDRSNFGSICDENTNTEVMDMDLDDEMSVYTSYSQDLGRGRGRRRRRRRSILLTRKPKKRASSRDTAAEKIECVLCKKVFYSANSLSKHNMTLAHVSKVSEQEYLLSKSHTDLTALTSTEEVQPFGSLGPYARRSTRRSTISEPPMQLLQSRGESNPSPAITTPVSIPLLPAAPPLQISQQQTSSFAVQERAMRVDFPQTEQSKSQSHKPTKDLPDNEYDGNNGTSINAAFNGNSRLNLNPDERLFFECCNILKSAETPRISNTTVTTTEECNINTNYTYSYNDEEKQTAPSSGNRPATNIVMETSGLRSDVVHGTPAQQIVAPQLANNSVNTTNQQPVVEPATLFRDPPSINQSNCYNKSIQDNRNARSPTYSAISQLSTVTNTTSRFKTKAAMKGYENVNIDLIQQQESKSRTICKLTELAEIALGNEEKPNSHDFSPIHPSRSTPPQPLSSQQAPPPPPPLATLPQLPKTINVDNTLRTKGLASTPEYAASLLALGNHRKDCNEQLPMRNERTKNNETRSSTSSKTIMHSSIIKAAVEEHQKVPPSNKIIIPERPFKNIGLEEKETITFQKPKTPAVSLLTEDNSVSTGSFSDRDDYDFGSLSCDDEISVRESNDKNQKNNSSESSSESSRATAKTFENKSLIMGRIFKNASTKAAAIKNAVTTVKVKSVGVQKDQTPVPKADLNQLFDELRGNSGVDGNVNERGGICNVAVGDSVGTAGGVVPSGSGRINHKHHQQQREISKPIVPAASPPAVVSSTTATPSTIVNKTKARASRAKSNVGSSKSRKEISKLQSELGMSPDEIKKLIDEGQRKSKRRCATNRPKKLVEMWSSDEYEEFLSTKDIIALIEEKEQQEKRRKRKSSVNVSSNTSEVAKEKDTAAPDVTSSTKEAKRRNTRRMSMAVERQEDVLLDHQDVLLQPKDNNKNNKKTIAKKEDHVSTTAIALNTSGGVAANVKPLPKKSGGKKGKTVVNTSSTVPITIVENNNISSKNRSNSNVSSKKKNKPPPAQKAKPQATAKKETSSRRKSHKKNKYDNDESNEEESDEDDDDEDDFLISDLKQKQNNKKRDTKALKKVKPNAAATSFTAAANVKPLKSVTTQQQTTTKKRGPGGSNNNNCSNPNVGGGGGNGASSAAGSSNLKIQQHQTPSKNKRQKQLNQSPPRRKRLATEKLYYWSSSSDEDFGRINNNKSNPPADNYESGAEQYQKHGWIVGDSHKKLVTLLAIAKGNKKVDSNSGVKKINTKRRN